MATAYDFDTQSRAGNRLANRGHPFAHPPWVCKWVAPVCKSVFGPALGVRSQAMATIALGVRVHRCHTSSMTRGASIKALHTALQAALDKVLSNAPRNVLYTALHKAFHKAVNKGNSQGASLRTSQNTSHSASQGTSQSTSQCTSQRTSHGTSNKRNHNQNKMKTYVTCDQRYNRP